MAPDLTVSLLKSGTSKVLGLLLLKRKALYRMQCRVYHALKKPVHRWVLWWPFWGTIQPRSIFPFLQHRHTRSCEPTPTSKEIEANKQKKFITQRYTWWTLQVPLSQPSKANTLCHHEVLSCYFRSGLGYEWAGASSLFSWDASHSGMVQRQGEGRRGKKPLWF